MDTSTVDVLDLDIDDIVTNSLDTTLMLLATTEKTMTTALGGMFNTSDEVGANMSAATTMMATTTMSTTTTTTEAPCYSFTQPPCDALIKAAYDFAYYGIYICYILGIPGSILTLIILARMRPFNSSSAWLCCLACTDLFGLTLRMILSIVQVYVSFWGWQDWWCRFYYIMARVTKHVSFFCLVGLTVERFIAVWFPLKMSTWCTVKRALISFFIITIVIIGGDLHMIETRRIGPGSGSCVIRKKYRPFWQNTYEKFILMSLYQTLPMVTLIILNVLISVRLRSSRKIQKKMTDDQAKEKEKQQKQIDRMLTAATMAFCLFVLPEIIFQYTEPLWAATDKMTQFYRDRARTIVIFVTNTLNVFNHAVNFILYVVVAQKFRAEIIRMLTCGKHDGNIGRRSDGPVKKV